MPDRWTPACLIEVNSHRVSALDADIFKFITVDFSADEPVFRTNSGLISPDLVARDAVAFLSSGSVDEAFYVRLRDWWARHFGFDSMPPCCRLEGSDPAAAAFAVARVTGQALAAAHRRNAKLMREVVLMRAEHDRLQSSFQKLETFLHDSDAQRYMAADFFPQNQEVTVVLRQDNPLTQRLPLHSGGLSDVAVNLVLPEQADIPDVLIATLLLQESGRVEAVWRIPGGDLKSGWLRLSLPKALGPDWQTALLQLRLEGAGSLGFATSHRHPDPRFLPRLAAPMLAMRVWRYLPDAESRLPPEGVVPQSGQAARGGFWLLGENQLRSAVPVLPAGGSVQWCAQSIGLAVSPTGYHTTAARLDHALPAGTGRVQGGVKTTQTTGPVVEYACAALPSRLRPEGAGLPGFSPALSTDWLARKPDQWGELHLMLPASLTEPHDLWLLTRLAKGEVRRSAPLESCFYHFTVFGGLPSGISA